MIRRNAKRSFLQEALTRLDARGRRRLSALGAAMITVTLFTVAAAVGFGIAAYIRYRPLPSLTGATAPADAPTLGPDVLSPKGVNWVLIKRRQPDGREVYVGPEEIAARSVSDFIDAWNTISFQSGFPEEAAEQDLLRQHFWPDSPAYQGAQSIIAASRASRSYWQREIAGQFSVSDVVEFSLDGLQTQFAIGFPEGSILSRLVDIDMGRVVISKTEPAALLFVTMRYHVDAGLWKVFEIDQRR